ncbi:MAG: hypothetical protein HY868_16845 [Chloroflexi bacterium]|nr:hypothetical protein [Chloroflexota bacterium]
MKQLFPIQIHWRDGKITATTAVAKLADDPDRVNAQLRDFAEAYTSALANARNAHADAKRDAPNRPRAYWRIGQAIGEFDATLRAAGFYLPAQNATFARDLGMHEGSLRKILAFYRRTPDANALDPVKGWYGYREHRTKGTSG